jgi:hypothetical protein
MRKGQAAMEFMMTYGWALLAALVGIGALAYFGIFNLDNAIPEKCLFSQGIDCVQYKGLNSGAKDNVTLYLKNNIGEGITIYTFNVSGEGQQVTCTPSPTDMSIENQTAFFCQFNDFNKKQVKLQGKIIYSKVTGEYNHTTTGDMTIRLEN